MAKARTLSDAPVARRRRAKVGTALALTAFVGCASSVDTLASDADAGAADDGATVGGGPCAHWALTDREARNDGVLDTDLHVTFDAQGRLATRREVVPSGEYGMSRTAQSFTYFWNDLGLTIIDDGAPTERTVFLLDGDRLTARAQVTSRSAFPPATFWDRDARGRVVSRTRVSMSADTPRRQCAYRYDAAGHCIEARCDDGQITRLTWEGDRLRGLGDWNERGDLDYRGWAWDERGNLVRELRGGVRDLGLYGGYNHRYDAAGHRVSTERVERLHAGMQIVMVYVWDEQGRLAREESSFDEAGVARSIVRWERDDEGRITARVATRQPTVYFSYDVSPRRIVVTEREGTWRRTRVYRCLATAPRGVPADPTPVKLIESTAITPEPFPANAWEP